MAESPERRARRYALVFAILSPKHAVPGATPEMRPGIRAARRLKNLLVAILAVSFLQAIWATFLAGTNLPMQPVALRGGVDREKAGATLHLTPEMNPLQLLFSRKTDARNSLDYHFAVRDAGGKTIATAFTGDYGSSDPKQPFHEGTSQMVIFEVPAGGDYTIEVEAVQRNAPTAIQGAAVGVRRNARDSHFLLTLLLSPFAAWLAAKWWRRRHGWIWETLMGEEAGEDLRPPPALHAPPVPGLTAAVPAATASSRLRMRPALDPSPPAPGTPPAMPSGTSAGPEIFVELTLLDRIKARAALEAWSLLLSAAQVPVVGGYTMLVLITVMGALGGTSPGTMDAMMQSPVTALVLNWFFPRGHYEGFAAMWAMGQAGGTILLVFHLLMTPVRLLWPRRPRRTYGAKLKLLLKANLVFVAVTGGLFLVTGMNLGKVLDGVTAYGILLAFLLVPSAVLLSVSTKLQEIIDAHDPPDAAAPPPTAPRPR